MNLARILLYYYASLLLWELQFLTIYIYIYIYLVVGLIGCHGNIKFEVMYIINLKTCFRALLEAFIGGLLILY